MGIWILIGLERRILWISDCLPVLSIIWDPHCLILDFLHLVSFYVSQIWCSTLGDPK
jgi:hypothetical protein